MATNNIDPEKKYRVQLSKVVELAPQVFARPHDALVVKGKVLSAILDAVETYEPAE